MDRLDDLVIITEVDAGPAIAGHIFARKFGEAPPDFPHHLVGFLRIAEDHLVPATYLHLWLRDGVGLVGGVCTDGRAFAALDDAQRARVHAAGGVYLQVVRACFARFGDRCDAFFGLVGDPRSMAVNLQAGFEPTGHDKLIAHWHRPLGEARKAELVERVRGFGAF
jgi:hypothetical protein